MLSIWIGNGYPNELYSTSSYFDFNYKPDWITDEICRKMIKDIDNSIVIAENIIESPILGTIPQQWLSGGVKTLIGMYKDTNPNIVYNLSNCGDDCADWIIKIGEIKDITVTLHHCIEFGMNKQFKARILNTNKIIQNELEYINEYGEIISGWYE